MGAAEGGIDSLPPKSKGGAVKLGDCVAGGGDEFGETVGANVSR